MVWYGASGHHFSMAQWLDFGYCGQLWLSLGPYYPSWRIRSANETVVYSKPLQNKPRTLWRLLQALGLTESDLCVRGVTQTMSHIVESCPLTKLDGGLKKLQTADWRVRGLAEFLQHVTAYANNKNSTIWQCLRSSTTEYLLSRLNAFVRSERRKKYDSSNNCWHMILDSCIWLCTLYSVSQKNRTAKIHMTQLRQFTTFTNYFW